MLIFYISLAISCLTLVTVLWQEWLLQKQRDTLLCLNTQYQLLANQQDKHNHLIDERLRRQEEARYREQRDTIDELARFKSELFNFFADYRQRFEQRQFESLKILQDTLHQGVQETRLQVKTSLLDYASELGKRVDNLTIMTEQKLKDISQQVQQNLYQGLEKTTQTFQDILQRLSMIDAAQQKITELSSHVVSLQEVLNDRKARGAFGEVQLAALLHNVIPEQHFSLQHTLSNGKRTDCLLLLPEPTGNIAIDAKFPLESFRHLLDGNLSAEEIQHYQQLFRQDVRKHLQDIADKYIIPGETAEGAIMFIPAESVFAEIHAHYSDLIELAQRLRVWMVSPTTMMAVLTTMRAVLKDAAMRKELHLIQKHLHSLAGDFGRFKKRMDNLARHIIQAHTDVTEVHTSAERITQRFNQIEQVNLQGKEAEPLLFSEQ